LILSPDTATTPAVSSAVLARRLLRQHVRPYALRVTGGMILMGVAAASTAVLAWLMKPVIDDVFVNRNHSMLLIVTVAVIGASLVKGIAMYGQTVTLNRIGQRIIADLQTRMFAQLMRADLQFFHDNPTGKLISRLTNDVNLMRDSGAVLLDAAPPKSLTDAIRARLETGDDHVADLHVWRVGPGHHAAIVSLVTHAPLEASAYKDRLADIASLSHVTVEINSCA
jgi:subfamily B ATP-binding cassette protein MsbA